MAGFQLLMTDDRDKKLDLAFKMFDIESNGYVSEAEMRRFLSTFFRVGEEGAQAVIHDFESLFGPDKAIAKHVHDACRRMSTHYMDVVMKNIFHSQKLAAPGPGGQRRLFITDFKLWSASNGDRIKDWLDSLGDFWLASIDKTVRGINFPDTNEAVGIESESVKLLERSIKSPISATEMKAKMIKQPGYFSGAPKIPPPNCSFPRQKVKFIQELFIKISQDGSMGPPEWKRCLRAAGIFNEVVSERLFSMFDTSGDKQMNAKEFTWGLSDVCSEDSPPGQSPRMTPTQVRRAFAYRFYDENAQGYFEKSECAGFLKSWVGQSEATVRSANERFMQTYGLDHRDLELVELPHVRLEQERLKRVRDSVDTELTRYVDDVFRIFAAGAGKMNYDMFAAFTEKAPIVIDWLTELGKYLDQQFPKLAGMNFEDDNSDKANATELSPQRMRAAFKGHSNLGVMTEAGFEQCLKALGPEYANKQFAKLLFRVVDMNKNGSLTSDEFVDSFTTIISGTVENKLQIAFQLHDVQGKGYLDRKSLRMFFVSFFGQALDEVNILASNLDQWINGQQKDTDAGFKSSEREKGLPSHYFIGAARKLNLEIAVNMRKAAAGQVSMLVDQMVDHAMRYASVSEEHLYANEFSQWMSANTKFVVWMENVGKAWMVTKQQKQQELASFAAALGGSGGGEVGGGGGGGGGLKPARAPASADAMQAVIKAGDVGKTVGAVVKIVSTGEQPYLGAMPMGPMTAGPGGTWWNRAFTNRSHTERTQVRPRTHFDYVTLADLAEVFQKEIAAGKVYTKPNFRLVMRDRLRFENALVSDRLYTMFDVNGDGNLDAEEVATGLVLMVRGTRKDRLKLAFSFFDAGGDGSMMKHEMRVFLRAFARVSSEVVKGLIESLSEAFGPVAITGTEVVEAQEFKEKVLKAADKKLERSTEKMVTQVPTGVAP